MFFIFPDLGFFSYNWIFTQRYFELLKLSSPITKTLITIKYENSRVLQTADTNGVLASQKIGNFPSPQLLSVTLLQAIFRKFSIKVAANSATQNQEKFYFSKNLCIFFDFGAFDCKSWLFFILLIPIWGSNSPNRSLNFIALDLLFKVDCCILFCFPMWLYIGRRRFSIQIKFLIPVVKLNTEIEMDSQVFFYWIIH